MRKTIHLLLACVYCMLCVASQAAEWEYQSGSDVGFKQPLFRQLALTSQKPGSLDVVAKMRGPSQRYTMLRYGTPDSIRVGIVVDQISPSEFDLYVDANRDYRIMPDEKVAGEGKTRQFELAVEIVGAVVDSADSRSLMRRVELRHSRISKSFAIGTAGYLEGETRIADRVVAVRRVDGDGDGMLASRNDRIWFDLNHDDLWDGFSEQFAYLPILKFATQRYQLQSNTTGAKLAVAALTESGTIKLKLDLADQRAKLISANVMLVNDAGAAMTLDHTLQPTTLPTGDYSVEIVSLSLKDGRDRDWEYTFSRTDNSERPKYRLKDGQHIEIDPIGKLRFALQWERQNPDASEAQFRVQPQLYTGDNLLVNSVGLAHRDHHCDVLAAGKSGRSISQSMAGFS